MSGAWVSAVALVLLALVEALPDELGAAAIAGLDLAIVVTTVGVGAVLVWRMPRHIVGWLLLAGGYSVAVNAGAAAAADFGLSRHPGSVPGAIGFAVIASATGGILVGFIGGFVPFFFPTGRLPSPRWRFVVPIGLVATFLPVITAILGPLPAGTYPPGVGNPLALGGIAGQLVALLVTVANLSGALALGCVVVSLVVRYRRAQGVERAQLKWFAYVGLVVVPALVVAVLTGSEPSGPLAVLATLAWCVALGGLVLFPITIGIAILRYRLYEIDRLVSRTISWAGLTVILGASFVAAILLARALLAPVLGSNEIVVAGSTLLVAALFQPIRRRVQRLVDRRFNRARYDAEATVSAFAGRLRDEVDLQQLRAEILATVSHTVEPSSVSLWLRE